MATGKKIGFARLSKAERKAVASKGGSSVPPEKRTFSVRRDIASLAGKKSGRARRRAAGK